MRRTFVIMSVMVLALTLTPDAGAAPEATDWWMTCDLDGDGVRESGFVATGNHRPAWAEPWTPGDSLSGGIFMGGTQTITFDGEPPIVIEMDPPAGLVSKVVECGAVPLEPWPGVTYVADPAWIFVPPGAALP